MANTSLAPAPAGRVRPSPEAESFLHGCSRVYEAMAALLGRMDPDRDPGAVLRCVHRIANFAWVSHPGRYADGALENIALRTGARLQPGNQARGPDLPPRRADRHVLHVATALFGVGGHTRLLLNWIRTDTTSQHSVLLTAQGGIPIPAGFAEAVRDAAGALVTVPPGASLLERARVARRCAGGGVDLVLLHHHPDDPVPTVAFAAPDLPPVAVVNHADHVFWLGGGVADAVVNLREVGRVLSEGRRLTRNNLVLPLPLSPATPGGTRAEARASLHIPDGQVLLLSVGTDTKYCPTPSHDFFRTAAAVLERNPEAHLYLIGPGERKAAQYAGGRLHPRLHALDVLEDLTPYQAAADVYLEGFPFSSPTALLEAARRGIACVGALAPPSALLAANDLALSALLVNPPDEQAYVAEVTRLVRRPEVRAQLGAASRRMMEGHHCGDGWLSRLDRVYSALGKLAHAPAPIPGTALEATRDDCALSAMQAGTFASYQLLRQMKQDLKYFLPAGLIQVLRFSRLFRDLAWGRWYAELWANLLKTWALRKLGRAGGASHRAPQQQSALSD